MALDEIVRVTATIEPASSDASTYGRTLFFHIGGLTETARADLLNIARDRRVNVYRSLAAVGEDYATTHEAYLAAQAYFSHPVPQAFMTGAWFENGVPTYIIGATGFGSAAALTEIKNAGTAAFAIAGGSADVDLNVSATGAAGYTAVASAIQTGLRTISGLSAAECTFDATAGSFRVEIPKTVDVDAAMSGAGAEAVGLAGSGSVFVQGIASETIAQALARINGADDSWHWGVPVKAIYEDDTDVVAFSDWFEDDELRKQALIDNHQVGALTASEATSRSALLAATASGRTGVMWSAEDDFKMASLAGLFAGVDFTKRDSLITAFGKTLPGRAADNLTSAQRTELDRKRINYYTSIGGHNIVRPGAALKANTWLDSRYWLDWLTLRIQTDIYDLIRTAPRVPLTPRGAARIQAIVEAACEAGVANGGLASEPVKVSTTVANEIRNTTGMDFDGTLARGYLVYVEPVSSLTVQERQERQSPNVVVWLQGSGAVHFVEVSLQFSE